MTPALLALALAGLPEGAVRYRAELAGVPVGVADLRISCGVACRVEWRSQLRLPEESGGGVRELRVEAEVDGAGRYRGGPLRVRRGAREGAPEGLAGAVPSALVELVLAGEAGAAERCVTFFDEERPAPRRACARREGPALAADVGGVAVRIEPGADGFADAVVVGGGGPPGRGFRWVRDPAAALPPRAVRLAGTRVPGPADPRTARAFCGVPADPPADARAAAVLPPPRAGGESCREKTTRWLSAARALGHEGRTAIGVAWDGEGFVWHAWAELRAGGRWIAVDPSFGERPARGPRFTLARYADGDAAARDAAGARILACWGSARVE